MVCFLMRCLLLLTIMGWVFAASPQPTTEVEGLRAGLLMEVYDAKGHAWQRLPVFDKLESVASEVVDRVVLRQEHKKDYIGLRFTGYLIVREAGEYVFGTESDDGSTIHLGGQLIVDNDGLHGVQTRKAKLRLERGLFPIRIRWYNGEHSPTLRAWWTGSSQSQMAFGGDDVYHPPTTAERQAGGTSLSLVDLLEDGPQAPAAEQGPEMTTPQAGDAVVVVQRGLSVAQIGAIATLAILLVVFLLWRLLRSDSADLEQIADDIDRGRGRGSGRRRR